MVLPCTDAFVAVEFDGDVELDDADEVGIEVRDNGVDGLPPQPVSVAAAAAVRINTRVFTELSSFEIRVRPRDTCREHVAECRATC